MPGNSNDSPLQDPDVLLEVLHNVGLGLTGIARGMDFLTSAALVATRALEAWREALVQAEADEARAPYGGDPWAVGPADASVRRAEP